MAGLPTVSILTPTADRRKFIPWAIKMFKAQTYPQDRMEWIILDDGADKVADLFSPSACGLTNVRYVALPEGEKLKIGAKRNRLNALAKNEICVAWDDDDFYPPERVKNAVLRLCSAPGRKVPVAGSSQLYLYYADRKEIWTIGPYNPNHCTNGTMAYWRTYTKDHRYDDNAEKAEERAFMDDWKTQVVQMKSDSVMLVICHSRNTFDKRKLLEKHNPTMRKTTMKLKDFIKDKKIIEFYNSLMADFADEKASAAASTSTVTMTAEELNPALQFTATPPSPPLPLLEVSEKPPADPAPPATPPAPESSPELVPPSTAPLAPPADPSVAPPLTPADPLPLPPSPPHHLAPPSSPETGASAGQ